MIASWRPGRSVEILPVTKKEYEQARPRQSRVVLRIKPGYFGYPWIVSYAIASGEEAGEHAALFR